MPVHDVDALLTHLGSLDEERLAAVLRRRPGALSLPWPADLAELAVRLGGRESIAAAYMRLPRPHIEVLGALTLVEQLGLPVTAARVSTWLGSDPEVVQPFLDDLHARALTLVTGGGEISTPAQFPPVGVGLGPPVRVLLEETAVAVLRGVAAALQLRGDGARTVLVDRLAAVFRDPAAVRTLVDGAPPRERELLIACAEQDAALEYFPAHFGSHRAGGREQPGDWAVARGVLWPSYDGAAYMPLEVSLALRGKGWRLPFHPEPPLLADHPVPAEHVDAEAAARLLRMIERVTELVDTAATDPIPLIKSGAVGVRTLRTVAKTWDVEVDEVRLAVELARSTGVLAPAPPPPPARSRGRKRPPPPPSPGLIPGPAAPGWRAADAATRGRVLIESWWRSDRSVLMEAGMAAELGESAVYRHLRHELIDVYATVVTPGRGVADIEELAGLLGWRAPLIGEDIIGDALTAAAGEGELLGLLALGAATALGRALPAGTLTSVMAELLSGAHTSAVIGADLTAVVLGPPATDLSRLLDSVADRESSGAATTWRFTPASIRAAFDRGSTAPDLIGELASIAAAGLPQALEYLIGDVARTHGQLGVIELGCAVVADDPTLLRELVGNRKLGKLGLATLAPTVLASRTGPDTMLSALRAAGYAPVLREVDGRVLISAPPNTGPADLDRPDPDLDLDVIGVPAADPDRHARHLTATAAAPSEPAGQFPSFAALRGRGQPEAIWELVAGQPAHLTHDGCTHLVHSARLHGNTLTAWSATTQRYEGFPVAHIAISGHPAAGR
ncbi:helicase-associated domain-containing protein [Rhodococcus opacus]|uniref:helicase-associated domain-containing protein n=1 Tax=Rhodococcus opacus TaxID=37919 RepID=UPI0029C577CA|nr:helicase-associated domain-containing protein [Rhodococcus opacus]MDX5961819.1 helicase-associated domain-containing protein [Rhodococcus opacus]